ncbi:hypothetical protein DFH11DRAFT_1512743 [Phellopilus nigrolimitatus]|nr:hypothetical protein DFH11DRAFT_1512743 [Phellopilus nigrolimitatus]
MSVSDPVADKSTFLCMYMSNHPDTLVAYVKYWGKVDDVVISAKMLSIDSEGMSLGYNVKGKGEEHKQVRVSFDPPLSGYEEVKPRLLSMTADAQEALGMTKSPQITSFHLPRGVYKTGILVLLLSYTSISVWYRGVQWELGHWLFQHFGGSAVFKVIWIVTGALHTLEAMYVGRLCVKHRTGLVVGFKYVLSTFLFGVTVLFPFRREIQKARINSIMKAN